MKKIVASLVLSFALVGCGSEAVRVETPTKDSKSFIEEYKKSITEKKWPPGSHYTDTNPLEVLGEVSK